MNSSFILFSIQQFYFLRFKIPYLIFHIQPSQLDDQSWLMCSSKSSPEAVVVRVGLFFIILFDFVSWSPNDSRHFLDVKIILFHSPLRVVWMKKMSFLFWHLKC